MSHFQRKELNSDSGESSSCYSHARRSCSTSYSSPRLSRHNVQSTVCNAVFECLWVFGCLSATRQKEGICMNSLSTLLWSFIVLFNTTLYNFGILDRADPHTKCDLRINQGIKEQRLVNLVPSLRSRPSSQRMVYDPESLMHFTLASAKPSLAVRNQRSRMKSPTPLPLAFLLPTLLCQQKKAMCWPCGSK